MKSLDRMKKADTCIPAFPLPAVGPLQVHRSLAPLVRMKFRCSSGCCLGSVRGRKCRPGRVLDSEPLRSSESVSRSASASASELA